MKKNVFIILSLCALFIVAGCSNPFSKEKYTSYEWHFYDEDFKHTEEFVAKYNDDGKLMSMEIFYVFPESKSCDAANSRFKDADDLKIEGVKFECKITDDGLRTSYSLTNKSIEAGYLSDENADVDLYELKSAYPMLKDEETAKESIQKLIDSAKENSVEYNDQNYAVIAGKKTGW